MRIVDKSIKFIQRVLRDQYCYLCDTANDNAEFDICSVCLSELPYKNQSCSRCALPLVSTHSPVCGQCLRDPPSYDAILSPFEYQFPLDTFITELKFRNKLYRAHTLGKLFSHYLQSKSTALPECIIPVPLHPKRLQQRGFNQSIEIARVIAKQLKVPVDKNYCIRNKNTQAQSDLNADQRHQNVKNAFQIKQPRKYQHVAIFDDVVTTGHTVEALATLLRQQNISVIQVWSIARVT
ncbi:Competence protein F homolog, phosphoribosyltransferase domain; protein YhgH required for utilization of DNA as sole source of carbon and energy [hydrothermal vent metagenome]|uniref:Competence protein F homolog, phosphoribosyltransferase domain protein YhgH required for utilization of DNA as sole source of carbon and energy n=1 Tax=hydrothermal vent metagenome TaxID=652676 RepID=A0A3B1A7B1_9ZZZZ